MERIIIRKEKGSNGRTYVLAMIYNGKEYVTWESDEECTTFYYGHYFRDLDEASADFKKRIK